MGRDCQIDYHLWSTNNKGFASERGSDKVFRRVLMALELFDWPQLRKETSRKSELDRTLNSSYHSHIPKPVGIVFGAAEQIATICTQLYIGHFPQMRTDCLDTKSRDNIPKLDGIVLASWNNQIAQGSKDGSRHWQRVPRKSFGYCFSFQVVEPDDFIVATRDQVIASWMVLNCIYIAFIATQCRNTSKWNTLDIPQLKNKNQHTIDVDINAPTFTVVSPDPEAQYCPSVRLETDQILEEWPVNTPRHSPVSVFHIRQVLSLLPEMIFVPVSPTKLAHLTLALWPLNSFLTVFGTTKAAKSCSNLKI